MKIKIISKLKIHSSSVEISPVIQYYKNNKLVREKVLVSELFTADGEYEITMKHINFFDRKHIYETKN